MPIRELMPEIADGTQPGLALSFESQLKLRSLYEYVDSCRRALSGIQRDLTVAPADVRKATEELEKFCVEADSWGFSAIYEVALRLQMLLLNFGDRVQSDGFQETLQRGLSMLWSLLDQCERDFSWRLATAEMLDSLDEAIR